MGFKTATGKDSLVMELPRVWMRPQAQTAGMVTQVSGWEVVEAAWRRGEGILFLTPHLGCFEITAQYYAAHAPITVLYRRPKQRWLQPLIEAGRGGAKSTVTARVPAGASSVASASLGAVVSGAAAPPSDGPVAAGVSPSAGR